MGFEPTPPDHKSGLMTTTFIPRASMNSVEVRARVSSGADDTFGRKSCNMKNLMSRQKTNQATAVLNVQSTETITSLTLFCLRFTRRNCTSIVKSLQTQ